MRALLARREAELAAGAEPVGWKVGFNVPAAWDRLGLDAPVAGYLTGASVVEPGGEVSLAGWAQPTLEPEIAVTVADGDTVGALAPAIEVVDLDRPLDDLEAILAGNVFHRAVAFGAQRPVPDDDAGRPASAARTLDGFACRVRRDGEEVRSADAAEDPAETVARVSAFLRDHGARLEAGQRIIAGTLTPPLPVAPGDEVEVDLGALGRVSLRFGP